MVNARLHVICGNCGGTNFTLKISPNFYDEADFEVKVGPMSLHSASLTCKDCSTIHSLEATFPLKTELD